MTTEGVTIQPTNVQGSQSVHLTEPPAPTADPATDGMPEGGVEKFWNAETKEYNWEADAKEKAWQLSQKEKTAPAAENTETIPAEGEENNLPDSAEQIAEAAGLDLQAVNEAILETGQFPAEAMEALKSVFPTLTSEDLEGYSAYLHDTVANHIDTVEQALGGDLDKAIEFARGAYDDKTIAQLETLLNDPNSWEMAASKIAKDMGLSQQGAPAQQLFGTNQAAPAKSQVEALDDNGLQQAIRDPRWKTDANFRNEIYRRAKASGLQHTAADGRRHTGGM